MILLTFGFKADAATDTSDMFGVSVVGARVESEYGVSGESSVSFDGDTIIPSLGTFNFPGAYSRISVDIKIRERSLLNFQIYMLTVFLLIIWVF